MPVNILSVCKFIIALVPCDRFDNHQWLASRVISSGMIINFIKLLNFHLVINEILHLITYGNIMCCLSVIIKRSAERVAGIAKPMVQRVSWVLLKCRLGMLGTMP